ncbi:hypothetical protein HDV01_004655 [Terramyces sp. JEL0728]|nr:hypothetical protein HDV01_004655 [Terramyces sp. JEL0728]
MNFTVNIPTIVYSNRHSHATEINDQLDAEELPEYEAGCQAPPPYAETDKYNADAANTVRKIIAYWGCFSFLMDVMLFFFLCLVIMGNYVPAYGLVVPLLFMVADLLSLYFVKFDNAALGAVVALCVGVRWGLDVYTVFMNWTANNLEYFDMPVFVMIFTLPISGVRPFYSILFPCFTPMSMQSVCEETLTNAFLIFLIAVTKT